LEIVVDKKFTGGWIAVAVKRQSGEELSGSWMKLRLM